MSRKKIAGIITAVSLWAALEWGCIWLAFFCHPQFIYRPESWWNHHSENTWFGGIGRLHAAPFVILCIAELLGLLLFVLWCFDD